MKSQSLVYRAFNEFKATSRIEVKRCYAAQYFRLLDRENTHYLYELAREEFLEQLQRSKDYVQKLSEPELDELILKEKYPKRLKMYNSCDWYIGIVSTEEVGVWKGAGGLPLEWTRGSLADTASSVAGGLKSNGANLPARPRRAIPRMLPNLDLIENDPYLYPIIAPGATMGRGLNGHPYKQFLLMKGDIEDGCMRSITLAVSGRTSFSAYVGVKRTAE